MDESRSRPQPRHQEAIGAAGSSPVTRSSRNGQPNARSRTPSSSRRAGGRHASSRGSAARRTPQLRSHTGGRSARGDHRGDSELQRGDPERTERALAHLAQRRTASFARPASVAGACAGVDDWGSCPERLCGRTAGSYGCRSASRTWRPCATRALRRKSKTSVNLVQARRVTGVVARLLGRRATR